MTPETTDPRLECAFGHRQRKVGCVSCVLVFDRAIPGLPIGVQEETTDPQIAELRTLLDGAPMGWIPEIGRTRSVTLSESQYLYLVAGLDALAALQQRVEALTQENKDLRDSNDRAFAQYLAQKEEIRVTRQREGQQFLRANTAEQRLEAAERSADERYAILDRTAAALNGESLDEFALSFPLVRQADDMRRAKEAAERELTACRRGRVGDAEIIGRHLSAKEAAEATIVRLWEALERIERWFGEFPATGRTWNNDGSGGEMSYAACYGSNGERDYMREVARCALSALPSPPVSAPEEDKP